MAEARALAARGYLVTFGIHPTHPETGYGYIRKGARIDGSAGHDVAAFVEKPDDKTAQAYVDSGDYDWNSGMFCFGAGAYLDALRQHAPEVAEQAAGGVLELLEPVAHRGVGHHRHLAALQSSPRDSVVFEQHDGERAGRPRFVPTAARTKAGHAELTYFRGGSHDRGGFYRVVLDSPTSSRVNDEALIVRADGEPSGACSREPRPRAHRAQTLVHRRKYAHRGRRCGG